MAQIGKKDIIWAYSSQILYSGINILILPFVLRGLSAPELGLWYTFTAIGALVSMLDFGFLSTILRNLTYAWNGAEDLRVEGVVVNNTKKGANFPLFSYVLRATKVIYFIIGSIALLLMMSIGTIYINDISKVELSQSQYIPAWICYAFAISINIYYAYWTPVLRSIGGIKESYQILVVSKVVQLLISIIGLLLGYGLMAIAMAYFLSQLTTRLLSKYSFLRNPIVDENKDKILKTDIEIGKLKQLITIMWPNAYKQGVIAISKFLTSKAAILICSSFLGLTLSSSYGLSEQLFGVLVSLSNVMLNSYAPTIGGLFVNEDRQKLYLLFTRIYGFQIVFLFSGGIALLLCGESILHLINSNAVLLPLFSFALLIINECIYNSFEVSCSYIALGNKIPMYKARIISSVVTIVLQLLLAIFVPKIGVFALLIPSFLVQLSYNGWRWIKYIADDFGVSLIRIHIDSLSNIIILNFRKC